MFKTTSERNDNALYLTNLALGTLGSGAVTHLVTRSIENRFGKGIYVATSAIMGLNAFLSTFIFARYFSANGPFEESFSKDSLQRARWKFFAVGTAMSATITTVALRVFTGRFVPLSESWSGYGLCLQAGAALAVGTLYTHLINRWGSYVLGRNPTREMIAEIIKGVDKETARYNCSWRHWKLFYLDLYGQREDVTPDELGRLVIENGEENVRPGDTLSQVSLNKLLACNLKGLRNKLLQFTADEPAKQLQILEKFPLDMEDIEIPKLHTGTIERLLENPSTCDLIFIQHNARENQDVKDALERVSDDEIARVVKCGLSKNNLQYMLATKFEPFNCWPKARIIPAIRSYVASLPKQVIEDISRWQMSKYDPRLALEILDQWWQRDDVDSSEAKDALMKVAEQRNQNVEKWYKGVISDRTLTKVLRETEDMRGIVQLMVELTYEEPIKQLRIFEKFPLGKANIGAKFPTLAKETIDALLKAGQHSAWQLAIYGYHGRVLGHLWADVSMEDLCSLSDESFVIALESIPGEKVIPLLETSRNQTYVGALNSLVRGRTRLEAARVNAWVREQAPANLINYLNPITHNSETCHALACIDEYGKLDSTTVDQLFVQFRDKVSARAFWNSSSWDLSQLSEKTVEKLRGFSNNRVLHLARAHPSWQIDILDRVPLGPHSIYHEHRGTTRFHYPRLHDKTINNLLKKHDISVWDLAFCARQRADVRGRLAEAPVEALMEVVNFRGHDCHLGLGGCWDNHVCWESSPAKIVVESLEGEKQIELLLAMQETVWFDFALRHALQTNPLLTDERLETWINVNTTFARAVLSARPHLDHLITDEIRERLIQRIPNPPNEDSVMQQFLQIRDRNYDLSKIEGFDLASGALLARLPRDVLNIIFGKLYPIDRARFAGTCRRAFVWIGGERGEPIWRDVGSIGRARELHLLFRTFKGKGVKGRTKKLLIQLWPRGIWPVGSPIREWLEKR